MVCNSEKWPFLSQKLQFEFRSTSTCEMPFTLLLGFSTHLSAYFIQQQYQGCYIPKRVEGPSAIIQCPVVWLYDWASFFKVDAEPSLLRLAVGWDSCLHWIRIDLLHTEVSFGKILLNYSTSKIEVITKVLIQPLITVYLSRQSSLLNKRSNITTKYWCDI